MSETLYVRDVVAAGWCKADALSWRVGNLVHKLESVDVPEPFTLFEGGPHSGRDNGEPFGVDVEVNVFGVTDEYGPARVGDDDAYVAFCGVTESETWHFLKV